MENDSTEQTQIVNTYDPEPQVIYTFSPIEYIEQLKLGKLWFAPTSTYNDIHENTIFARDTGINDGSIVFPAEKKIHEWLDSHVVRCFTTDPTNTLMWAHYANSHNGVCVGFRLDKIESRMINGESLRHFAVRYSSTPPLSLLTGAPDEVTVHRLAFEIMMTKSIHWAYEKEYRVYTRNEQVASNGGGLLDIGSEAVVDVIFGVNVEKKTIEQHTESIPEGVRLCSAEINSRALNYNIAIRTLQ